VRLTRLLHRQAGLERAAIEGVRLDDDTDGEVLLENAQARLAGYVGLVSQLEDVIIPGGPAGPTIAYSAAAARQISQPSSPRRFVDTPQD
jgi:hypothetical protein